MTIAQQIISLLLLVVSQAVFCANLSLPDGLELHADSSELTQNINTDRRNQSSAVDILHLLFDKFEDDIKLLNVPFSRSLNYIENGQPVCVVNKIKTPEREAKYLFTQPLSFFESQRLFQLSNLPPISPAFLNENGEVLSIYRVLSATPSSTILLPRHYSFGAHVDRDLAKINEEQIIRIANNDFYDSFSKIWVAQRTNYALIFPTRIYREREKFEQVSMRRYAIAGNPKIVTGHILCSNTAKGKAFVSIVNEAIEDMYEQPKFIQAHTRYLPKHSASDITDFIQTYRQKLATK